MNLTDTQIRKAKAAAKAYRMSDGHGLYMQVQPSGTKLWHYGYRFEGKQRLLSLGIYPTVTLAAAREAHMEARRRLTAGINPAADKQEQKREAQGANTFKSVALRWHSEQLSPKVDPDTAARTLRRLEADVFPALGGMAMNDIRAADVRRVILAVQQRGARHVAQRQHGTIKKIFGWAIPNELAERNPAADFGPSDVLSPRKKTQNRARVHESELPDLLVAMDEYDGEPVVRYALKLMALTFVRTQELLQAPWSEFDLDNARWNIPAERMKMGTRHIVPLPSQALAILRELKILAGDKQFVFPGLTKQTKHRTINCNSLLNVLNDIGYKNTMTSHGYRGLAGTVLRERGFDRDHVNVQLSHLHGDETERAYIAAQYLAQRTEMMAWWASYLDAELAKGRKAKIVPIRHSAA